MTAITIKKHSLVADTIEAIRQLIVKRIWRVGDRIPPESDLAEQFGVSRNTIREAIKVLSYSGIVEVCQGSGTYVRRSYDPMQAVLALNQSGLKDHLEMQCLLEVEAARYATLRRTDQDIEQLQQRLDIRGEYQKNQSMNDFFERDRQFHSAVVTASHNQALQTLYHYFSGFVYQYIQDSFEKLTEHQTNLQQHQQLVDAIIQHDEQTATQITRKLLSPLILLVSK